MNIEKLSCQLNCPDNSHVFDLLQSTSGCNSAYEGKISTILKGYGSATLEFGNCASSGKVQVFIKGKMIASLSDNDKKKIEFDFCDGDNLMLQEVNGGIILFSDFKYSCESEYLVCGYSKSSQFTILILTILQFHIYFLKIRNLRAF